jgi:hypothetical protein
MGRDWKRTERLSQAPRQPFTRQNRIKEQLSLFSDRLSTETMRANQLRLYIISLRAGAGAAAPGAGRYGAGHRTSGNDSTALAENGRGSASHRTTHLGALLARLPFKSTFRHRIRSPERLNQAGHPAFVNHFRSHGKFCPQSPTSPLQTTPHPSRESSLSHRNRISRNWIVEASLTTFW